MKMLSESDEGQEEAEVAAVFSLVEGNPGLNRILKCCNCRGVGEGVSAE